MTVTIKRHKSEIIHFDCNICTRFNKLNLKMLRYIPNYKRNKKIIINAKFS